MTLDYVNSAIRVMEDVSKKASSDGVKSIQLLVSIGVIAGIVRYLNPKSLPVITTSAVLFVLGMGVVAVGLDWGIKRFAKRRKYKLKFVERAQKI